MHKILRQYRYMKVPLFESGYIIYCGSWDDWRSLHEKLGIDGGDSFVNGASRTVISPGFLLIIKTPCNARY